MDSLDEFKAPKREFHAVTITADRSGYKSRIEIDGQQVRGVIAVDVSLRPMKAPTVTIELVPCVLVIEGEGEIEMHREILPIKRIDDATEQEER